MPKTIIISSNCQTYTWLNYYDMQRDILYTRNSKNEMWTLLSSNLLLMMWYGWLLKCLQYKTATSNTYTIMYPISTLEKWVINTYVFYKKCLYMGEKMRGVKKYSRTTMTTISGHMQYMHTLDLRNIPALLDIHDFCPSVKL